MYGIKNYFYNLYLVFRNMFDYKVFHSIDFDYPNKNFKWFRLKLLDAFGKILGVWFDLGGINFGHITYFKKAKK